MTAPTLRSRHDGWTADRQAAFIAALGGGSTIAAAAAAAGMSRRAAYRLRAHPAGAAVAAAWGTGDPPTADDFEASAQAGLDARRAAFAAAEAAYRGGDGVWLLRQLRADARRARRRAAAARRRAARDFAAENPVVV